MIVTAPAHLEPKLKPLVPAGPRYSVRALESNDFALLQQLEHSIWGDRGEKMLCPHYLRLCIEQFGDISFIAFDGARPVGYVLNVLRGDVAHCGTLAVLQEYRRSRVSYLLVAAMCYKLLQLNLSELWFTVSPENEVARQVHRGLGARVVGERRDYYGPGDTRLVSKIDLRSAERLRARFTRNRRDVA
jgi:ribosomal protein S18 acetylase RimI-like enzyme